MDGLTPIAIDDEYVVRAFQYLTRTTALKKKPESKTNDQERAAIAEDFPVLCMAQEIYTRCDFLRWALEALVVSKMPPEEIAARIPGGTKELVQEYEAMFFDVRDRLSYRLWVMSTLLGAILQGGLNTTPDSYWKAIAYFFGSAALEEYWQLGRLSPESAKGLDDVVQGVMRKRALEAQLVRPVDRRTAPDIMTEYLELVKAEKLESMGRVDTGHEQSAKLIMQALQAAGTLLTAQQDLDKIELRPADSLNRLLVAVDAEPEDDKNLIAKQPNEATIIADGINDTGTTGLPASQEGQ